MFISLESGSHCSHSTCGNIPVVSEGVSMSILFTRIATMKWYRMEYKSAPRFAYSVSLVATSKHRCIMAFCRV